MSPSRVYFVKDSPDHRPQLLMSSMDISSGNREMRLGRPARKLWHEMVFLSKSTTFPSMVRRTLLKPPVVTRFPDGYMKTGSSGLPHPKDFWRCHWFFRAATGHIPLIF